MRSFALLILTLWPLSPRLSAHHSFAASFQADHRITLAGVVTKVEWANPHMYFFLKVRSEDGKTASWICEAAGPNTLARHGWTRNLINAGDLVTVIGYRARGDSPVASARVIILKDGRRMLAGSAFDGGPQP